MKETGQSGVALRALCAALSLTPLCASMGWASTGHPVLKGSCGKDMFYELVFDGAWSVAIHSAEHPERIILKGKDYLAKGQELSGLRCDKEGDQYVISVDPCSVQGEDCTTIKILQTGKFIDEPDPDFFSKVDPVFGFLFGVTVK